MGDIEFHVDEMRAHTDRLQGLADRAQEANNTAQDLSSGAGFELYGVACSPILVPVLNIAEASQMSALSALAETMDGRHEAMESTTRAYEGSEEYAIELSKNAMEAVE